MATTTMRPNFAPKVPQTLEELGISHALVLDLMLRRLLHAGVAEQETAALGGSAERDIHPHAAAATGRNQGHDRERL
jgi:hypothetical protein